jgi:hypothetical protein
LPDRQPGTEEFLSSRLLRRRLDPRLRPAVAEHQRFEIVAFRLPWRAAAVAVRRVAVA